MNRSLITSLLLSALLTVTAQPLSVSKHISVDNGLSNNFVLDICTDSYGSVWVATESGLTRIAGKTVEPLGKRELTDTERQRLDRHRRRGRSMLQHHPADLQTHRHRSQRTRRTLLLRDQRRHGVDRQRVRRIYL